MGRGVVPESNQMSLGAFNAVPLIEEFYKTLDLMIVVGSRLRGHETRDMSLKLPHKIIQIDIDPDAENRTYKTIKNINNFFSESNEVKLVRYRIT